MDTGRQLTALADPTRRKVFEMIGRRPRAVGEIAAALPVTRPAVSQHLRVLRESGLVSVEQRGTRRIYSIDRSGLDALRSWIDDQWDAVLDAFEAAARAESEHQ